MFDVGRLYQSQHGAQTGGIRVAVIIRPHGFVGLVARLDLAGAAMWGLFCSGCAGVGTQPFRDRGGRLRKVMGDRGVIMKVRETVAFCLITMVGGFASYDERSMVSVRWCMHATSAAEIRAQKPGHDGRSTVRAGSKNDNRVATHSARVVAPENPDAATDKWGQQIDTRPEFYAAADVPAFQITLTRKWYQIAAQAWGNYGPLEFWIVGSSKDAASQLDQEYCRVRKQKDPAMRSVTVCVGATIL